ncbi:hypothetical protein ACYQ83_004366 [Salmonella enterica subsp. enterica serovar Newport]
MEKLTIDQKLQAARVAADITISAASKYNMQMFQYLQSVSGKPAVMDIYRGIYTDIIKTITSEPDNI